MPLFSAVSKSRALWFCRTTEAKEVSWFWSSSRAKVDFCRIYQDGSLLGRIKTKDRRSS